MALRGVLLTSVTLLDTSELKKAKDRLLNGDVVAIPTETVYGLAASIESEKGLRKIFALKERPFFDPLIVHVASFKEAAKVAKTWPPLADFVARFFWPGPLTIVLPKADSVNPLITSGLDTVAIRYPSHPIALELIRMVGTPLAAPSANRFGRTSPSRAGHVRAEFPGSQLLILDGGECEVGLESTVISIDADESKIRILRPGAITAEMLAETLKKWSKPVTIEHASSAESPGHLKHHYMPNIPLVIVRKDEPGGLSQKTRDEIASQLGIKVTKVNELVLNEEPAQAARELYAELRRLSESGADLIYVREPSSDDGLWRAIWDRLTKAASLDFRG